MSRLLLDWGLPRTAARLLSENGIDTVHVGYLGMAGAADNEMLEFARTSNRAVVTLDADFHTLLALSGASLPSVIRLRAQGLKARDAFELILSIFQKVGAELASGVVISATSSFARVKRLPITRQK